MKRSFLYIILLLAVVSFSSCKIGKSYTRPDLHLPDSLARNQDTLSFGDMDWWEIYTDSTLRGLISKSLEYNKDLLIAAARVKEMAAQKRISFTRAAAIKRSLLYSSDFDISPRSVESV